MTDGMLDHFHGVFDSRGIWNTQPPYGEIKFLFRKRQMSPSEIDKELGLDEGTARVVIMNDWQDDKTFSARLMRHG